VCPERHVAGMILDDSMWMGGTVVEELCEGFHGGFGAFCLLRGQSAECCEHGGINGPGIVEEYPDDFLDMFAICCVQGWGWRRGLVQIGFWHHSLAFAMHVGNVLDVVDADVGSASVLGQCILAWISRPFSFDNLSITSCRSTWWLPNLW